MENEISEAGKEARLAERAQGGEKDGSPKLGLPSESKCFAQDESSRRIPLPAALYRPSARSRAAAIEANILCVLACPAHWPVFDYACGVKIGEPITPAHAPALAKAIREVTELRRVSEKRVRAILKWLCSSNREAR